MNLSNTPSSVGFLCDRRWSCGCGTLVTLWVIFGVLLAQESLLVLVPHYLLSLLERWCCGIFLPIDLRSSVLSFSTGLHQQPCLQQPSPGFFYSFRCFKKVKQFKVSGIRWPMLSGRSSKNCTTAG